VVVHWSVLLTGNEYEAVVLPEDQEFAGFVPLLSIAYTPIYVAHGTNRVSLTRDWLRSLASAITLSRDWLYSLSCV